MNIDPVGSDLVHCCVCTNQIVVDQVAGICNCCKAHCHVTCLAINELPALMDQHCINCICPLKSTGENTNNQSIGSERMNDSKTHKPTRLELFNQDELDRPLLNNKDLDPDKNYFCNNIKECEYHSPSQLVHRFNNISSTFSMMHLNCRSITPKLDEIQFLL